MAERVNISFFDLKTCAPLPHDACAPMTHPLVKVFSFVPRASLVGYYFPECVDAGCGNFQLISSSERSLEYKVPKEAKVNKNSAVTVGVRCGDNGCSCTTEVLTGNESAFFTAALDLTVGFLVINDQSGPLVDLFILAEAMNE